MTNTNVSITSKTSRLTVRISVCVAILIKYDNSDMFWPVCSNTLMIYTPDIQVIARLLETPVCVTPISEILCGWGLSVEAVFPDRVGVAYVSGRRGRYDWTASFGFTWCICIRALYLMVLMIIWAFLEGIMFCDLFVLLLLRSIQYLFCVLSVSKYSIYIYIIIMFRLFNS